MKVKERKHHIFQFVFVLLAGLYIAGFSTGVSSVKAAQSQEVVELQEEETPLAASADNAGSSVFLLMGGMLLIILTVVITVVATFIVTAPIADEI